MARRRSGVRRAGAGRRIPPGVMLGIALAIGAVILVAVQANNNNVSQAAQQAGDGAAGAGGGGSAAVFQFRCKR